LKEVDVCLDVEFNPHRPIKMVFHRRLGKLKALGYIQPALPTAPTVGPRPAPPDWGPAVADAQVALDAARLCSTQVARVALDRAYRSWAQTAEKEIIDVTGAHGVKTGLRGAMPKLVMKPILRDKGF